MKKRSSARPAGSPTSPADGNESIVVRGAREHNLRDIHLTLPRHQLIVLTGVSGSGKSSLAFDTLYAEGQRRYIQSMSSYARQFLGQMHKPDVDYLGGLSPSISIEQKTGGSNPRSTVGTITEIHDYLRVLFARVGRGHCPNCGDPIEAQSREQILGRILEFPAGTTVLLLAPVVRGQKGEFKDYFEEMVRRGFVRARVDGQLIRLTDKLQLDRQMRHHIEIVIDRIKLSSTIRPRLAEAVENALNMGEGSLHVLVEEADAGETKSPAKSKSTREMLLSARYACAKCNLSFSPPSPQMFSFNSPQGMCPECDGLGNRLTFDRDLLIPDGSKSFKQGAIATIGTWRELGRWRRHLFEGVAEALECSLDTPWDELTPAAREGLLYGTGDRHITFAWRSRGQVHYHGDTWPGIIPTMLSKYRKTTNPMYRLMYEKYMRILHCEACAGERLNPQARNVRLAGRTITEMGSMPIDALEQFFAEDVRSQLSAIELTIAGEAVKEIRARLGFLLNVGLQYLTLDRAAPTLSGGEAQRIRLASQIGSGLVGVLYILDEPSIGLHPRDNSRLIATLKQLRDQGNTVIVVEHDEETMREADHLVDFGPGPGIRGGEVVAEGNLDDLMNAERSLTGQYLSGQKTIPVPEKRRAVDISTIPKRSKSAPKSKTAKATAAVKSTRASVKRTRRKKSPEE